jgi:hypothetical protein
LMVEWTFFYSFGIGSKSAKKSQEIFLRETRVNYLALKKRSV